MKCVHRIGTKQHGA